MKRLALILALLLLPALAFGQLADCNSTTVQTALTAVAADNTVISLPAGTCNWSSGITYSGAFSVTIQGTTTCTVFTGNGSCTDGTILVDNIASSTPMFSITSTSGKALRITGITFKGGTGLVKSNGVVAIGGQSKSFRFDHNHFDMSTYSPLNASIALRTTGGVEGVVDHNVWPQGNGESWNAWMDAYNGGTRHSSWAAATGFGTSDFMFYEDNTVTGTGGNFYADDCDIGAKAVVRYNVMNNVMLQTHPTGSSGDTYRGCRAKEIYQNVFSGSSSCNSSTGFNNCRFNVFWLSSGPALVWNNTINNVSGLSYGPYQYLISAHSMRRDNSTYSQAQGASWGYCGPKTISNGTITVDADGVTVHWSSGDTFDTSWVTNAGGAKAMLNINGITCSRATTKCQIASITSTTQLTLASSVGQISTPTAYSVGSGWDQAANNDGSRCIDDVANGVGDLLTGTTFGTMVNSTTGTVAWPNQALEPVYEWGTTGAKISSNPGGPFLNAASAFTQNSQYYLGDTLSGNTYTPITFDGTVGVGSGLLAARPATCTTGVAYWETDHSQLDKCTATNTWTAYYTPYTYPHPLDTGPWMPPNATSLSYANQTQGTTSASQDIVLTNSSATLTRTFGTITVPTGYTKTSDPCSGQTIAAGATCTVSVAFAPPSTLTYSGNVSAPSDAPDSPTTVAVSGTGTSGGTPPTVTSFTTSQTPVRHGQTFTLSWTCSNTPASAVIDNGVGTVTPAAGGTTSPITMSGTKTYSITCANAGGTGGASVTVTEGGVTIGSNVFVGKNTVTQ